MPGRRGPGRDHHEFLGFNSTTQLGLVLVVAGVCVITFIISHLIPGDPARLLAGDRASDEIVRHIRQQLGLDLPLWQQFSIMLTPCCTAIWGPPSAPVARCWKI